MRKKNQETTAEEEFYMASQWQLMWRKFGKHKLAIFGGTILVIFYIAAILCEFIAPYAPDKIDVSHMHCPLQRIHFFDENGKFRLRPFIYGLKLERDPITLEKIYKKDENQKHPVYFLVHGDKYKLWNLLEADIHLFGVKEGTLFLFGTDDLGRDLFSRNLYAARVSLSVGLIGVALSLVLGCVLGGISGYYGGATDTIIQRVIELLMSMPAIPLWMALTAALPLDWSPIKIYFSITIILSILSWCVIGRVVRGKILQLREEDFTLAAKIVGATDGRIITRHLLPSLLSLLIVNLTLAIPNVILAETALSFLGLGLRSPVISWGVLLKDAQNVRTVAMHPWLLIPGLFVIITVLAFNFLGDGLRDAADPYK